MPTGRITEPKQWVLSCFFLLLSINMTYHIVHGKIYCISLFGETYCERWWTLFWIQKPTHETNAWHPWFLFLALKSTWYDHVTIRDRACSIFQNKYLRQKVPVRQCQGIIFSRTLMTHTCRKRPRERERAVQSHNLPRQQTRVSYVQKNSIPSKNATGNN